MQVLRPGTIKRIHVDQRVIRQNVKRGENASALTIQTSRGSLKARTVHIEGPSALVQRFERPLSCGARVWIETRARVSYE